VASGLLARPTSRPIINNDHSSLKPEPKLKTCRLRAAARLHAFGHEQFLRISGRHRLLPLLESRMLLLRLMPARKRSLGLKVSQYRCDKMRLEHLSGEEREGKRRSPVGVVVGRRLLRMGRGRLGMGGEGGRIEGRAKGRLRTQSVREVSYGRMGARGADRPREAFSNTYEMGDGIGCGRYR
jgi:hypothetical protein